MTLEIGIWRSLFRLVTRRVLGRGPGIQAFSYAKGTHAATGAFIFVSLFECQPCTSCHRDTVRLIAAVLSIWGRLRMIGMLASAGCRVGRPQAKEQEDDDEDT